MKLAIKIIPLVSVFVYLCVGMIWKCWHPGWLIVAGGMLLTGILKIIDESKDEKKENKVETPIEDAAEEKPVENSTTEE